MFIVFAEVHAVGEKYLSSDQWVDINGMVTEKTLMGQCEENNVFASKLLYCNLNYIIIRK